MIETQKQPYRMELSPDGGNDIRNNVLVGATRPQTPAEIAAAIAAAMAVLP